MRFFPCVYLDGHLVFEQDATVEAHARLQLFFEEMKLPKSGEPFFLLPRYLSVTIDFRTGIVRETSPNKAVSISQSDVRSLRVNVEQGSVSANHEEASVGVPGNGILSIAARLRHGRVNGDWQVRRHVSEESVVQLVNRRHVMQTIVVWDIVIDAASRYAKRRDIPLSDAVRAYSVWQRFSARAEKTGSAGAPEVLVSLDQVDPIVPTTATAGWPQNLVVKLLQSQARRCARIYNGQVFRISLRADAS